MISQTYEVEGAWLPFGNPRKDRCRKCGAVLVPVPREGTYNSRFWDKEKDDGLGLFYCPNGCSEESATLAFRFFHSFSHFCTNDSTPYNYKVDFSKFKSCWISPEGVIYPVSSTGHSHFARYVLCETEIKLEEDGWIKITEAPPAIENSAGSATQRQKNALFDYAAANKLDTEWVLKNCDEGFCELIK